MTFQSFGLCPALLGAIDAQGFQAPSEVQSAAIPAILQNRDVLVTSPTGSGKTAAYALPLLQRWSVAEARSRQRTLVLVPTRELARQVSEAITALAKDLPGPKVVALYGGVSINPQLMSLRGGADFIVATPGRLLDVLQNNGFRMRDIGVLVLDEADRMLDLGFADELNAILEQLPKACQGLMFSALMAPKTHSLAMRLLNDPVHIALSAPSDDIEQRAIEVDHSNRLDLLVHLMEQGQSPRTLVFCASRVETEDLAQCLRSRGVKADALYGGLPQETRDQVLGDLKSGAIEVLVATDLAARGIDISALPLVVNYDLPRSPSMYTQRIGRTGRAGQRGQAISFVDADSHAHFKLIEKRLGFSVEREQIPGFLPVDVPNPRLLVGDGSGGIKGKRPSKKDKLRAAAAKKRLKE